ncbi:uncharacterized protein LACBIDRAFT_321397 [Laccaria bicolor S238N-H82]|uniref:Predicted protein n=1 Tax=Laccaria bicolor (strain S238N-H82 / ATCC MYA-4686) TaxID=486041 RepID=B0CQ16_LACBS|nr:uncharacterized protein LACBIDRAFT_321397 [Laccaria bicolor S238N-H82]EDR16161.1 predicted protein [Laccaria bicolor S238N-H82]|eukprot:XP_001874369.1 predicted protein [Laccaria bicolor S238N-H82]
MGATHLWEIVQPARQMRSLSQLTVSEGFEKNRNGRRAIAMGVDASIWLHQTQAVFHHACHSQAGENPELRILFYKLKRFLNQPVNVVFVFDSDGRPSMKRGKHVRTKEHWLTKHFQEFAQAYGFTVHIAPGEAEAELALLNKLGIIDIVITDDSDALVFGATCVMRNPNLKKDNDNVALYTSEGIRTTAGVHVTQGGMLLIAILCGGDYDKVGLVGCGKVVAHGLARTTLGDQLLEAARDLSEEQLETFLVPWHQQLQEELLFNKQGFLKCRYPAIANAVRLDFPQPSVILKYTQPVTSWAGGRLLPPFSTWVHHEPDVAELASLAERSFSWPPDKIMEEFRKHVWPGLCLRRLLEVKSPLLELIDHVVHGVIIDGTPCLSSFLRIHRVSEGNLTLPIPFFVIEILEQNLINKAVSKLRNQTDSQFLL